MTIRKELHDALTGAYSRDYLNNRLVEEVERGHRYDKIFSLLYLDIDYFKSINDAFGRIRGDEVLLELVHRLQQLTRRTDLIFRYGGDQFILLIPESDKQQAVNLAHRLFTSIPSSPFPGEPPLTLSLSIGVATFPEDGQTPEAIFETADNRHILAKRGRRGHVISESEVETEVTLLHEPARLIEREAALDTINTLINNLPSRTFSLLGIMGPASSGKSRMLNEVRKSARLRGLGVLEINGQAALQNRLYGALLEARTFWEEIPNPSAGIKHFAKAILSEIAKKDLNGVLITVDNIEQIDPATLNFLRDLLFSSRIPNLGLAYTCLLGDYQEAFPHGITNQPEIHLEPLARDGVRTWIRQTLQWEAPHELVEWLHQETNGLPGRVQRGLLYLLEEEYLTPAGTNWSLNARYTSLDLHNILLKQEYRTNIHLPATPTPFVGRDVELQKLKQILNQGRMITITGPDGIGKTRLAIQAAAESASIFDHGVYYVPIPANRSTPDFLVSAIANATSFPFLGPELPRQQIFDYLSPQNILLVIDQFECCIEGIELLGDLLDAAPSLHMLITTREKLNIPGEYVYDLGGLRVPREDQADEIEECSAIQLFLQSAKTHIPNFTLTPEDKPHIVQICRLLKGVPLAIELAAAWFNMSNSAHVANHILKVLNQSTNVTILDAILSAFWVILNDIEKSHIRQLAVFEGEFSAQAAMEVIGCSPFFLNCLASRAYLRKIYFDKFEMHPLLRSNALEQLHRYPDEERAVRARHAQYTLEILKEQENLFNKDKVALENIRRDLENVRSGWNWTVAQQNLELLEQIHEGLYYFYRLTGLFQEGERMFRNAIETLQSMPDSLRQNHLIGLMMVHQAQFLSKMAFYDQAVRVAERAAHIGCDTGNALLEGKAEAIWGKALWRSERHLPAREHLLKSQELSRAQNDLPELASTLNLIGNVQYSLGDYTEAKKYYEESRTLFEKIGNKRGISNAINSLGSLHLVQGDYKTAQSLYEFSLRLSHEIEDKAGVARSLNNLGIIAAYSKDFDTARTHYGDALKIYREIGSRRSVSSTLNNLGEISVECQNYSEAVTYFNASLSIDREINHTGSVGYTLNNLGHTALLQGNYNFAADYYTESLHIAHMVFDRYRIAENLIGLAGVCMNMDPQPQSAIRGVQLLAASQSILQTTNHILDPFLQPIFEKISADAHAKLNESDHTSAWESGAEWDMEKAIQEAGKVKTKD